MDYDERSGNNMASKGRVQSLCQPGYLSWICLSSFGCVVLVLEQCAKRRKVEAKTKKAFFKGDILASEDFKLNTILPEITRAWEAENNHLVEDW